MSFTKTIYLAGGCFWGTEHLFRLVPGVESVTSGYANSGLENPTYQVVCTGITHAVEAVKVDYSPRQIKLEQLLKLFLESIDPLAVNHQGNDYGSQYRSGIYYVDESDKETIEKTLSEFEKQIGEKTVVELLPLKNFFVAEDYHQNYMNKNPRGYCHIHPYLFIKAHHLNENPYPNPSKMELRERLTDLQWNVTQNGHTEPPFNNEYVDEFSPGIYVDIVNGEPLFLSSDKFDSGCGWPAFSRPLAKDLLEEDDDLSHGRVRREVRAANSHSHLGHVFMDGPISGGGRRYCINSAALFFIPLEKMEKEGYGEYIPLVKKFDY